MNLTLTCKVSLSKKLRNLVNGNDCNIILTTENIQDGKGIGRLSITSEGDIQDQFDTTETSIMITPIEISQEVPEAYAVGSIFSTDPSPRSGTRTPVDRMAATEAPEKGEIASAIVKKEEVKTPQAFKEIKDPRCDMYIKNIKELLQAANEASNKDVNVDIGSARNERERALLIAQKEKGGTMSLPAYVINEKAGILSINDLGVVLHLNTPFNLANLSGKKVAESSELRGLISAGIVRFISPQEAQKYMDKMDSDIIKTPSLDIFDNRYQAEAAIVGDNSDILATNDIEKIELTMDDLEAPTQEESMIINLTDNIGIPRESSNGTRTSVHGSGASVRTRKNVPSTNNPTNNSTVKTIRKV